MSECIKTLLPGEKVARDVFARYTQFQRALVEAKQQGKKLVLVINEAQRLNQETIYGVKMLHEAGQDHYDEHLFSIIFVGQLQLKNKTTAHELNFRIRRYEMKRLNLKEVQGILNANHFKCNVSILRTIANKSMYVPMGVNYCINLIQDRLGINSGELTIEQIYSLPGFDLDGKMRKYEFSNQEFASAAQEVLGKHITPSSISKVRHGKMEGPTADTIMMRADEIIEEGLRKRKESPKVEHNMA